MPILKIKKHDDNVELDFELKYQMSLTFEERYKIGDQTGDGSIVDLPLLRTMEDEALYTLSSLPCEDDPA